MNKDSELQSQVIEALKGVYDPEIPINIYDLGLVYDVSVAAGHVAVQMTLTAPSCPVAGSLPGEVEMKIRELPGVVSAQVELVWEPAWTIERMPEEAKLQLGLF
ncbi:MAG: SUF system Fe-S cluster assembly protein [Aphanocapsa lilacina HA4352-LM1]|jgi:FeS assembly SUF system protein|uniref:SUF system Fe-S cluster assembly protein n=1 Tax=Gloeobacter morelensis MG652769 TaxID=2781736 RepID=A0ABY3PIK0_9CYAN|nr:SUF system Fe-S cluster assembly protein [Gloeobacter morelensis]MBW4699569.1 SUF system Fe-S cluster assembly protein [Aphanocapsa lilacina HA4352-LM1]UFP93456.1 SUF system Fe-S cluster assembly protein [Gloeobacter morelensis MG652769]